LKLLRTAWQRILKAIATSFCPSGRPTHLLPGRAISLSAVERE
jgi:hypothetical protein